MRLKKIILGLLCAFIIFFFFSGLMKKSILSLTVLFKTDVRRIESITIPPGCRPQVLIIGTDAKGKRKAVWLYRNTGFFTPKIYAEVNMDDVVTKEKAISILKENKLVNKISNMEFMYDVSLPQNLNNGAYWEVEGVDYGNEPISVFLNAETSKYIILDQAGRVLFNGVN